MKHPIGALIGVIGMALAMTGIFGLIGGWDCVRFCWKVVALLLLFLCAGALLRAALEDN